MPLWSYSTGGSRHWMCTSLSAALDIALAPGAEAGRRDEDAGRLVKLPFPPAKESLDPLDAELPKILAEAGLTADLL